MKKNLVLVTIPHASFFVPQNLRKMMLLADFQIKKHCDQYTDQIYRVPNAHVVEAKLSRLVADVNRAPDDIELVYKLYHDGVVVKVDDFGAQIYKHPPKIEDIFDRVEQYHAPFHKEIDDLASQVKFLIDGHSYWSKTPSVHEDAGKIRPEISLGNRDFTTCSRQATSLVVQFFEKKGFSVAVNDPYPGKYVIGYHCSRKILPGFHIEIRRDLYMNEETLAPYPDKIQHFNALMTELVELITREIEKNESMGKRFV